MNNEHFQEKNGLKSDILKLLLLSHLSQFNFPRERERERERETKTLTEAEDNF